MIGIYLLIVATCLLSAVAAAILKASDGLTKPLWSVLGIGLQLVDYIMFARIVVYVNIGVAYAIFAGGAILGSFVLGAVMFRERLTPIGYVSAAMIVFGIVFIRAFGTL